jgi:prepilin-type N-terminal cleavage/methylation domain-containing protein
MIERFIPIKSGKAGILFRKYLTGFTLIELLVTLVIMAIMAVIAIPAFSNYGERADFSQKMDQVQELLNKTIIQSQNPVQGDNGAGIEIGLSSSLININLYNLYLYNVSGTPTHTPTSSVQTISLPSNEAFKLLDTNGGAATSTSLICQNTYSNCCINDDVNQNFHNNGEVGAAGGDDTNACAGGAAGWFSIKDKDSGQTATFTKLESPTRVTHIIQ